MYQTFDDLDDIRAKLEAKKIEHRDLDAAIDGLLSSPIIDQLTVQRLKKRKLSLKDEIAKLEAMLVPDIIA